MESAILPPLGDNMCSSGPPGTSGWEIGTGLFLEEGYAGGGKLQRRCRWQQSETLASAKDLSISNTVLLVFSKMRSIEMLC